jgi:TATA-box binding protein (TBP) (component of TFIID and TFIIIB)
MVKTVIVNVVSTAHLPQKLDLRELEQYKEILHDTEIDVSRVAYFKL